MKEKQNIGEIDWPLIGKYITGEATPSEAKQVEEWRNQSDENQTELLRTRQMLEKIDDYYHSGKFKTETAWQQVCSETGGLPTKTVWLQSSRKKILTRVLKYAAVILIAFTLGFAGYYFAINHFAIMNREIVSGEKQVVSEYILPDGSLVALNSNSRLIFPKTFKKDIREVTIVGEAFFEVEPNPEKPFIIHAGNAQVKVLGTAFNVRAYPETETVEVIVEAGKVQVSGEKENSGNTNEKPDVVLNPGEKGVVFSKSGKPKKSINTDRNFSAWKTQNLVFNETPLKQVADYLKEVYHVEVQLKDKELNNLTLTATFNKKPVDFVLNVIQLTFDLELTKEKDLFILSSHKKEQ